MEISKEQFFKHASKTGISSSQADVFWESLEKETHASPFSKLLFYFGAMIVILAMTCFMNESWRQFGGAGIFFISIAYALLFIFIGAKLWKNNNLRVPAGLFITMAVCMAPL